MSLLVLVLYSASAVLRAQSRCTIELPVYDPLGTKVQFHVDKVQPIGAESLQVLDQRVAGTFGISRDRESIYFESHWLKSRGFAVILVGPNGAKISLKVPVTVCRSRQSTVFGNREGGGDVAFSVAKGRIAGCILKGDWWIRLVPLFGGGRPVGSFEGRVDIGTGEFVVAGNFSGERHAVLVGHGKNVVRTISADLIQGGENTIPQIILTKSCR